MDGGGITEVAAHSITILILVSFHPAIDILKLISTSS